MPLFTPQTLHTLGHSLRTSYTLAEQAPPTPQNLTTRQTLRTLAEQLLHHQPLNPADLDLLRRSLTSTQALVEMGCPHTLTLAALTSALHELDLLAAQMARGSLVA